MASLEYPGSDGFEKNGSAYFNGKEQSSKGKTDWEDAFEVKIYHCPNFEFRDMQRRLDTFTDWPHEHPTKLEMAEAGFYYEGSFVYSINVERSCFYKHLNEINNNSKTKNTLIK